MRLPQYSITLYDILMPVQMSDDQLNSWVAEAEEGYDVEALQRRGRGRPGRGASPSQIVAVRLTAEEIALLDHLASARHATRSEVLRHALMSQAA